MIIDIDENQNLDKGTSDAYKLFRAPINIIKGDHVWFDLKTKRVLKVVRHGRVVYKRGARE